MKVRENLLKIFNQYQVQPNEESESVAKDFKFKFSKKEKIWISLPREIMGEKMSALFKRFMEQYKKNYRVDVCAKEFYQLNDEEIESMFDELPYYLKSLEGRELYKPNAASFLKERIWTQDYPNKPKRDRTKAISAEDCNSWEQYIAKLPEDQRMAPQAYKDIISFDKFKLLLGGRAER
jgi:hypothetical protein